MTQIGTPSYIAPEILEGESKMKPSERNKFFTRYNAKVDSWSFALVFIFCLKGELPSDSKNPRQAEASTDPVVNKVIAALHKVDPKERLLLHEALGELKYNLKDARLLCKKNWSFARVNLLHVAASCDFKTTKWVLDNFVLQDNPLYNVKKQDDYGSTFLHFAAVPGHLDILKYVKETCDEEVFFLANHYCFTVLHHAAYEGYKDIVEWMLDNFDKERIIQTGFKTPASKGKETVYDVANKNGNTDVCNLLLNALGEKVCKAKNYS